MKLCVNEKRNNKIMSFNEILPSVVRELNLKDDFILINIQNNWEHIVGKILSVHTKPINIYRKILSIYTDHPIYTTEITFMKNHILSGIEKIVGGGVIINFKIEGKKKNNVYTHR